MNILTDAIRLLTQPPGDLVYFLVTLFALQQAFIQALLARKGPLAQRWVWATGSLLLGRGLLILLGLLGMNELLNLAWIIPPLEQALNLAGILLVLWALLGARPARWHTWLLGVFLIALAGYYIYIMVTWPALETAYHIFHATPLARLGDLIAIALLLLALVALLTRPPEWEWAAGVFLFWLIGQLLQLSLPVTDMHFAVWGRLTALVIFPLLAIWVQRQLVSPAQPTTPAPAAFDVELLGDTLHGIEAARELEPALIVASSRLAKLLDAEMCAIALTVDKEPLQLRVVALHPPTGLLEPPLINLPTYSPLADVWHNKSLSVFQGAGTEWLADFYERLGLAGKGPLVALPLLQNGNYVGLLLLGNPESGRRWESAKVETCRLAAMLLAGVLGRTRKTGGDSFLGKLREREPDEDKQRLTLELEQAQAQVSALEDRSLALQDQLQTRDREIVSLNRELHQQQQTEKPSATEILFWQTEVQEIVRDREILLEDRAKMAQQMVQMKGQMDALEDDRLQLQTRVAALQSALDTASQAAEAQLPPSTAVGLLVADRDGVMTMVDPLARQILHLPPLGAVLGTSIALAHADPEWAQLTQALLNPTPQAPRRAHLTLSDASGRAIEADLVALIGHDGQRDGLAISVRTEESQAEHQEAIAGLVNEFRTPMTALTGYTDLLLGEQPGILTEMQRQFLERMRANVQQLGQLLNDLLQLASPRTEEVLLTPQPIDLLGIIEVAIAELGARFHERRLDVRMDFPPGVPPVRADRDSLYQIMVRLLSNAAQCSRPNSEVRVSAVRESAGAKGEGDIIRISVSDSGGGIATEDIPKVFRRYYRAGQPLIAGMGETGIGLAVAKTLVENNGGRIWVESKPGEGSVFSFILPVY